MISIVNKDPSGIFKAEEQWIQFTELNDSLIVRPATPVLGVKRVVGYNLVVDGSFEITFRYSLDEGLNWSEWMYLSQENLQKINPKANHWLTIETSLINTVNRLKVNPSNINVDFGSGVVEVSSNTLWDVVSEDLREDSGEDVEDGASLGYFQSIEYLYEYNEPAIPDYYKDFNYSKYIPYYNHFCIDWTLNVLQKIYKRGIVPRFIKRSDNDNWDDEDYINFWYHIIYLNSMRIWDVDVLNDMLWYPRVLHSWLESKGLILGSDIHLDELFYLMSHFYEEMMRRGTLSLFDRSRDVDSELFIDTDIRGEFFRLIDGNSEDEIITALIPSVEQGWIVGYSSSCEYSNTDYLTNFTKCWENKISDLEKYPLFNSEHVSYEEGKLIIRNTQGDFSGVGLGDFEKQTYVDISKDYFFIVRFKAETSFDLRFGCIAYNNRDDQISLEDLSGEKTGYFIRDKTFKSVNDEIVLFGEMRAAATTIRKGQLDGICKVLKFPDNESIYKVMPFFTVRTLGSVVISDIRFGLLSDKDVYISSAAELYLLAKNNNTDHTTEDLREILEEKLLPIGIGLTLDIIEETNLRTDISNVILPQQGGVQNVSVMMDIEATWNIFKDVLSWFDVTPDSGAGNAALKVSAGENNMRGERYDQFDIGQGKTIVTISVTQRGLGYVLEIPSLTREIGPLKQILTVNGTSNCKGIMVATTSAFVNVKALRIDGELVNRWDGKNAYNIPGDPGIDKPYDFEIDLEILENSVAPREISVEFRGIDDEDQAVLRRVLNINQSSIKYVISVSPLDITIPSSGNPRVVAVETNSEWNAKEI